MESLKVLKIVSPIERITKEEFHKITHTESTTAFPKWLYRSYASSYDESTNVLTIYQNWKLVKFSVRCHPHKIRFKDALNIISEGYNLLLYKERLEAYSRIKGPVCGDKVRFIDGKVHMVSHVRTNAEGSVNKIQTSPCGSCYMGSSGRTSYSGGLDRSIEFKHFVLTEEVLDGIIWFFDQDIPAPHKGITWPFPFKVWECNKKSPKARPEFKYSYN